jgi:predicted nucleotidyltransferase
MALKPEKRAGYREVTYNKAHWALLRQSREKATPLLAALENAHLHAFANGSLARGDVNPKSDIDIFILEPPSSFQIETALEKAGIPVNARLLVQATPNYTMKAQIEIDPYTSVSFPLLKMRKVEREFYRFGGEINHTQLQKDTRVAGVDKRLLLIEPIETGHVESSIVGREAHVAKLLEISAETVLDRVHALLKRDAVGRTGVFIKKELTSGETFELALKKLAERNPAVRRKIKKAGL